MILLHPLYSFIYTFNRNVLSSNAMCLRLPGWQDPLQIGFSEFVSSKVHILVGETNNKFFMVGYMGLFVGVGDTVKKWGREGPAAHGS